MIGKQTFGDNFRGCLDYVLTKPGARFLASNMVGTTPAHLAIEFNLLAKRNQRVKYPVCHISLSPHPKDYLEDNQTLALVGRCLQEIGLKDCQWILAQHRDTHTPEGEFRPHLHLIVNRVRLTDGKTINCWQSKRILEKALRKLEKEFHLKSVQSSWETKASKNIIVNREQEIMLPNKDEQKWHQLRWHLAGEYKLPPEFCEALYQENLLYASETGEPVFVKRPLDNQNNSFFWLATKGEINRVIITDNPLEVVSAFLVENERPTSQPTLYLSLEKPEQLADNIFNQFQQVTITSKDRQLREDLLTILPNAQLEDNLLTWNQIWLSQQQKKQLHKQQARHQFQLDFISRQYQRQKTQLQL